METVVASIWFSLYTLDTLIGFCFFSGTVIRDEIGLSLVKVGREVLGTAAKVVLTKDTTTIVGDGSTQDEVTKRVAQIKSLIEV